MDVYSLNLLEARCPKPRCGEHSVPPKAGGEEPLCFSASADSRRSSAGTHHSHLSSLHMAAFFVCLRLFSSFHKDPSHWT